METEWATRPIIWRSRGVTCSLSNVVETGAALSKVFWSGCRFGGIPEPADAPRQEARPGCGPGRGKKIMSRQMYKIKHELTEDDRVAMRLSGSELWRSPLGPFQPMGR